MPPHNNPPVSRLWGLTCCIFLSLNEVDAQELNCPPTIASSSIKLLDIPASWTGSVQRFPLALRAAGFFDGPPANMAELKPFSVKEENKSVIEKWIFASEYKWPEGKWLSCDYGEGVVSLSKEIPVEISECSVIYKKNNKNREDYIQITCK